MLNEATFVLFANGAELIHFSYRRYLENRLREAFGFNGTPLRLFIRERAREEHERKRTARPSRGAPRKRQASPAKRS